MKIYIGRHGQSISNAERIFDIDSELSPLGIQQAEKLARRVVKLDFEIIISSDLKRAVQTAEIISRKTDKKIVVSPLFREEIYCPEFENMDNDGPDAKRIKKILLRHRNNPRWHFSKEESFSDLKKRAKKCLRFLEERKEKNIFLIGHARITKMFIGVMIFGKELTPGMYYKMRDRFLIQNSGLIVCKVIDDEWKLETWNDQSHLG